MSESAVVAECLEWLALRRIRAHRNNTGAVKIDGRWIRFGHPGSGDIVGLIPPLGIHLEVECKTLKGKPRKLQLLRHELINGDGGVHVFARSADELERSIRQHPRLAALGLHF